MNLRLSERNVARGEMFNRLGEHQIKRIGSVGGEPVTMVNTVDEVRASGSLSARSKLLFSPIGTTKFVETLTLYRYPKNPDP